MRHPHRRQDPMSAPTPLLGTSHLEINVSNFFTFLLGAAVGAFTMAALQAASIIVREMTTLQEELDDM